MTISCKSGNSPVEYPSREGKHDIKESKGNMFNPIAHDENLIQWRKSNLKNEIAVSVIIIDITPKHNRTQHKLCILDICRESSLP